MKANIKAYKFEPNNLVKSETGNLPYTKAQLILSQTSRGSSFPSKVKYISKIIGQLISKTWISMGQRQNN